MKVLVIFACAAAVLAAPQPSAKQANVVNLNVYYESLCPDSKAFIRDQLVPTWTQLKDYMNVTMNPFGKATVRPVEAPAVLPNVWKFLLTGRFTPVGESWEFTCQHGPSECEGNVLQACVLKYSQDPTVRLNYINCLMQNPGQGEFCGTQVGQSYTPEIQACFEGLEGRSLLQQYGVETNALEPSLTFVPWMTFNGAWSSADQWSSLADLKAIICSKLDPKPAECAT